MRFLFTAIVLCAALFGPTALRAQPADHPHIMLPMPDFSVPRPSRWAVGVHASYTLGMHSAFPASEGEFETGTGHGFNAGIGTIYRFSSHSRFSLLGHLMFERRPGSFRKTIDRYDAVDAEGAPIITTAAERADLRYDMIVADLLITIPFHLSKHNYYDFVVALGPSLDYVVNASSDRRITVPEPYHLPVRSGARSEDAGRTVVVDGIPDGLRRFHPGVTIGGGMEIWDPWSGQAISLGVMFDYAPMVASRGSDWRAHAVRMNLEWSRDVRDRNPPEGDQPL